MLCGALAAGPEPGRVLSVVPQVLVALNPWPFASVLLHGVVADALGTVLTWPRGWCSPRRRPSVLSGGHRTPPVGA